MHLFRENTFSVIGNRVQLKNSCSFYILGHYFVPSTKFVISSAHLTRLLQLSQTEINARITRFLFPCEILLFFVCVLYR